MTMTRDSVLWWLLIVGGVLAYLSQSPSPTTWSYPEWIKALSMLVSTVAGKLATSPLPGAEKEVRHDTVE